VEARGKCWKIEEENLRKERERMRRDAQEPKKNNGKIKEIRDKGWVLGIF
jgi:hypothetical protein